MTIDPTGDRPRKAVGPDRPIYLGHTDVDRLMAVLLALISEVSSIRDRLDSHERLAVLGQLPSLNAVEEFMPDDAVEQTREVWRDAYINRLFRVLMEDIEALKTGPSDQ